MQSARFLLCTTVDSWFTPAVLTEPLGYRDLTQQSAVGHGDCVRSRLNMCSMFIYTVYFCVHGHIIILSRRRGRRVHL